MSKRVNEDSVVCAYEVAKKAYAGFGIDTDKVIDNFKTFKTSIQCWQGDDVEGFEGETVATQNVVTGNYFGRARNGEELRADLKFALNYTPSSHKVNLHAIYAEPKVKKDRVDLTTEDFSKWIEFAKENNLGLDFNPTFFASKMMDGNMSLTSKNKAIRDYWVKHGKSSRRIANDLGQILGQKCVNNVWIPDGMKDSPANKNVYRAYLEDSLNQIFEEKFSKDNIVDVVEGKVFGIGTETFVVGSHEFYSAYALTHKMGVCLDTGHYHPTENVADKISAFAPFFDDILFHISRGVRWDSDHVVTQRDELFEIMQEIKRGDYFNKFHIGLDYFDASINRVTSWIVGIRAADKAMLAAMLEPSDLLLKAENSDDLGTRLALNEEFKNLPINSVWDMLLMKNGIEPGSGWIDDVKKYEAEVQSKRK